jgi:NAD-dependent SIR2 family protein deacetylase
MLQCMQNGEPKTFIEDHQRLFVLTGAGCSTNSGIPDYRDADGNWKRISTGSLSAVHGG